MKSMTMHYNTGENTNSAADLRQQQQNMQYASTDSHHAMMASDPTSQSHDEALFPQENYTSSNQQQQSRPQTPVFLQGDLDDADSDSDYDAPLGDLPEEDHHLLLRTNGSDHAQTTTANAPSNARKSSNGAIENDILGGPGSTDAIPSLVEEEEFLSPIESSELSFLQWDLFKMDFLTNNLAEDHDSEDDEEFVATLSDDDEDWMDLCVAEDELPVTNQDSNRELLDGNMQNHYSNNTTSNTKMSTEGITGRTSLATQIANARSSSNSHALGNSAYPQSEKSSMWNWATQQIAAPSSNTTTSSAPDPNNSKPVVSNGSSSNTTTTTSTTAPPSNPQPSHHSSATTSTTILPPSNNNQENVQTPHKDLTTSTDGFNSHLSTPPFLDFSSDLDAQHDENADALTTDSNKDTPLDVTLQSQFRSHFQLLLTNYAISLRESKETDPFKELLMKLYEFRDHPLVPKNFRTAWEQVPNFLEECNQNTMPYQRKLKQKNKFLWRCLGVFSQSSMPLDPLILDCIEHEIKGLRTIFMPAEDRLISMGIDMYGNNHARIADTLLPGKTEAQITNRIRNITSKRVRDNPIFITLQRRRERNKTKLIEGVRLYGENFSKISTKVFEGSEAAHVLIMLYKEIDQEVKDDALRDYEVHKQQQKSRQEQDQSMGMKPSSLPLPPYKSTPKKDIPLKKTTKKSTVKRKRKKTATPTSRKSTAANSQKAPVPQKKLLHPPGLVYTIPIAGGRSIVLPPGKVPPPPPSVRTGLPGNIQLIGPIASVASGGRFPQVQPRIVYATPPPIPPHAHPLPSVDSNHPSTANRQHHPQLGATSNNRTFRHHAAESERRTGLPSNGTLHQQERDLHPTTPQKQVNSSSSASFVPDIDTPPQEPSFWTPPQNGSNSRKRERSDLFSSGSSSSKRRRYDTSSPLLKSPLVTPIAPDTFLTPPTADKELNASIGGGTSRNPNTLTRYPTHPDMFHVEYLDVPSKRQLFPNSRRSSGMICEGEASNGEFPDNDAAR